MIKLRNYPNNLCCSEDIDTDDYYSYWNWLYKWNYKDDVKNIDIVNYKTQLNIVDPNTDK